MKNLMGGAKPQPQPTIPPPVQIPLPDDEAVKAAKKKSLAAQKGRSGRQSTILTGTDATDTLGAN